jgi:regulator of sirC expression with transglutaminase-like and TPR domain
MAVPSAFSILPDHLILAVLTHLPPTTLCAARACDRRLQALAAVESLWEPCHRRRWTRPATSHRPASGWLADFARRSEQDGRVLSLLRDLRESPRMSAARARIWNELMAPGMEVFDAACSLAAAAPPPAASAGGGDAVAHEAELLLEGLNQNEVRVEFEALLQRARMYEANTALASTSSAASSTSSLNHATGGRASDVPAASASPPPPLAAEDGALLLVQFFAKGAALRDPKAAVVRCRAALDALADRLRQRLPRASSDAADAAKTLSRQLFAEDGFHGNEADYYAVNNSLLDRVLEQRTGIPITLSVLFAAICRRVGVHLDMIGLPGHFLLATRSTPATPARTFIDAFHGGRIIGLLQCEQIVASFGFAWSDSMVAPVPMTEVWARMLRNLDTAYRRIGDVANAEKLAPLLACCSSLY